MPVAFTITLLIQLSCVHISHKYMYMCARTPVLAHACVIHVHVHCTCSEMPNYGVLIPALISHGVDQLSEHCSLTPGIPLKPMLAHPTKGVQEVLKRFESAKFTSEWKYDGERAQIHVLEGGETRIYSRNSENNTSKYPDIIARMPKVIELLCIFLGFSCMHKEYRFLFIKLILPSFVYNPISNSLRHKRRNGKKQQSMYICTHNVWY